MTDMWSNPITSLAITVLVYLSAQRLALRVRTPLLHPILVSIIAIAALLSALDVDYATYQQGGTLLSFWLGPATVALAVPLYRQLPAVLKNKWPILAAAAAGSAAAALSAASLARLFGAGMDIVTALIPKSVTTPIALEIADALGTNRELAAGFVIVTGILGAAIGPEFLRLVGVTSPLAQGLALGTASHGIGTARALQEGTVQGSTSGLAMGIAGILTTLFAPIIAWILT